jgi:hypothetical protein
VIFFAHMRRKGKNFDKSDKPQEIHKNLKITNFFLSLQNFYQWFPNLKINIMCAHQIYWCKDWKWCEMIIFRQHEIF